MQFLLAAIAALILLAPMPTQSRDNGQWAQADPQMRQWFRSQRSPQNGMSCCDEADGVFAEEDIRDGHYWARFVIHGTQVEWMLVPDDVVIREPNRHGSAVVWWKVDWDNNKQQVEIRCYAPGGGV